MITTVKGRFGEVEGSIALEGDTPALDVSIPVRSVDTGVDQRDQHLRSGDFFDAESHPHITFTATGIEGSFQNPGDSFQLRGDLTIRGTAKPVTLDVTYEGEGQDPWGGTRALWISLIGVRLLRGARGSCYDPSNPRARRDPSG